jgi:hypothetical protein
LVLVVASVLRSSVERDEFAAPISRAIDFLAGMICAGDCFQKNVAGLAGSDHPITAPKTSP